MNQQPVNADLWFDAGMISRLLPAGADMDAAVPLPEMSGILALAPETVHMERAVASYPPPSPCLTLSTGKPAPAWAAFDFGPSGVIGDPILATPAQGEAILASPAARWAQAIGEIHRMRWVERDAATWGRQEWQGFVHFGEGFSSPVSGDH